MKYAERYIQSAKTIIQQYDGAIPFAAYLKLFFAAEKKYGSKDRKQIAHLCYCYYRLGHALKNIAIEEKIKVALFLCHTDLQEWSTIFNDEWLQYAHTAMEQRIEFVVQLFSDFVVDDIFIWQDELSNGINVEQFVSAHLLQPDLFLRIRPNKEQVVVRKLEENKIAFTQLSNTCIALPNASKIDTIVNIDEEVVVQDYSSQRIN
jgi:16S rRNA (cytosine967-C5)-methyltransferase